MEIANATAGGPAYGLLDVIFGQRPLEGEEPSVGTEFQPLMNMIKALHKKLGDESGDSGRSEQGTAFEKDMVESHIAGNSLKSSLIPQLTQWNSKGIQEKGKIPVEEKISGKEGELAVLLQSGSSERLAQLFHSEAQRMELAAQKLELSKLPTLDPAMVDQMLEQKNLTKMDATEMRLLTEVNSKMHSKEDFPSGLVQQGESKTGSDIFSNENKAAPANTSEIFAGLNGKEIGPRATPNTEIDTQTYMRLHGLNESGPKHTSKNLAIEGAKGEKNPELSNDQDGFARLPLSQLNAGANKGQDQSGKDFGGSKGSEDQLASKSELLGAKGKLDSTFTMGAPLLAVPVSESRDVFISSTNPTEVKQAIVGEMVSTVSTNALKGGGEMKLVLHPDDMGEIKLKIGTKGGNVEVKVEAGDEKVARMLKGGSKDLEAALGTQNLKLTKFEVTVSSSLTSSLDQKHSLNQQIASSQGSSNFNLGNGDQNQFSKWNGTGSDARQEPRNWMDPEGNFRPGAPKSTNKPILQQARRTSSKLDVVA